MDLNVRKLEVHGFSPPDNPTDQIVNEVGEGPDDGHAGEGNAEQDDVQEADAQDVRQPHPSAVHHSGVGVHLAVRRAHVHDGALPDRPLNSAAGRKQNSS